VGWVGGWLSRRRCCAGGGSAGPGGRRSHGSAGAPPRFARPQPQPRPRPQPRRKHPRSPLSQLARGFAGGQSAHFPLFGLWLTPLTLLLRSLYTKEYTTFAFSGFIRKKGDSDAALEDLARSKGLL
jgi:hypothetical protein